MIPFVYTKMMRTLLIKCNYVLQTNNKEFFPHKYEKSAHMNWIYTVYFYWKYDNAVHMDSDYTMYLYNNMRKVLP